MAENEEVGPLGLKLEHTHFLTGSAERTEQEQDRTIDLVGEARFDNMFGDDGGQKWVLLDTPIRIECELRKLNRRGGTTGLDGVLSLRDGNAAIFVGRILNGTLHANGTIFATVDWATASRGSFTVNRHGVMGFSIDL